MTRSVVLYGMMGSGKTTVARLVGQRLGRPVLDTDEVVEATSGRTIAETFARQGEAEFRRLERTAVIAAAARDGAVVSVGGGAVLDDDNLATLRGTGVLVYLAAPAAVLEARVGGDGTRPLLADRSLADLLAEREPRYRAVADHVVDATGTPEEVAAAVIAAVTGPTR